MSAQHKFHINALRSALLAVAAVALTACSIGSGPSGVPQDGAMRTGVYPNFAIMPQGETKQLTDADKSRITNDLNRAKAGQGQAVVAGSSRSEIEAHRRRIKAETDATLKAIETGQ